MVNNIDILDQYAMMIYFIAPFILILKRALKKNDLDELISYIEVYEILTAFKWMILNVFIPMMR